MTECEGCGIDTDIESFITIDNVNHSFVYQLCGFCGDKVKEFIEKQLP